MNRTQCITDSQGVKRVVMFLENSPVGASISPSHSEGKLSDEAVAQQKECGHASAPEETEEKDPAHDLTKPGQCRAGTCGQKAPRRAKTPDRAPSVNKKIIKFSKQFVDFGHIPNKERALQMIECMGEQRRRDKKRKPSQTELFNRFMFESNVRKLEVLEDYYLSVKERTKQLAEQMNNPSGFRRSATIGSSPTAPKEADNGKTVTTP